MISSGGIRILADSWFTALLQDCDHLENEIQRRFGSRARQLTHFSTIRGMLAWWIARDYDFVATHNRWPGSRWLVFLTAWLGGRRRRKIILLDFISCPERLLNRVFFSIWFPLIYRPAIRRAMVAAQVMCPAEPGYYAKLFGIDASRFQVIPLPLVDESVQERNYSDSEGVVFASARGLCDWETLFRAAKGASWILHVACSRRDRKRVDRLNKDGHAAVETEIPRDQHAQIMASAAVYVLPLPPRPVSCGQLRVRDAISAGTPIVCTRVPGLEGYAIHNQTASVVEVGDHVALRAAIDKLLSKPESRRTLATRARDFARARTPSSFARAINEFVWRAATDASGQVAETELTLTL